MINTTDEKCPYCGSTDIEFGEFNAECGEAWEHCSCVKCGKQGQVVYKFINFEWED